MDRLPLTRDAGHVVRVGRDPSCHPPPVGRAGVSAGRCAGCWLLAGRPRALAATAAALAATALLVPAAYVPIGSGAVLGAGYCLLAGWLRRCARADGAGDNGLAARAGGRRRRAGCGGRPGPGPLSLGQRGKRRLRWRRRPRRASRSRATRRRGRRWKERPRRRRPRKRGALADVSRLCPGRRASAAQRRQVLRAGAVLRPVVSAVRVAGGETARLADCGGSLSGFAGEGGDVAAAGRRGAARRFRPARFQQLGAGAHSLSPRRGESPARRFAVGRPRHPAAMVLRRRRAGGGYSRARPVSAGAGAAAGGAQRCGGLGFRPGDSAAGHVALGVDLAGGGAAGRGALRLRGHSPGRASHAAGRRTGARGPLDRALGGPRRGGRRCAGDRRRGVVLAEDSTRFGGDRMRG